MWFRYLTGLLLIILAGLLIRKYQYLFPLYINLYLGDFLWAIALYLSISIVLPNQNIITKILLALAISYSIELSQLWHTPWLEQMRSYTLVRLITGVGFLWSDIVAYSLGIFCVAISDLIVYASCRRLHA